MMECIHRDKPCPYRRWVCDNGKCWWNCQWSCPHNSPFGECELAKATWGCLFLCVYDAIAGDSGCPYKAELKKELEQRLKVIP